MRKLRNKLLLSILTVALTFIALGTTTFAWFTLGGTATANAFEAEIKTPDGIEVSLDQQVWGNALELVAEDESLVFADITSADGISFVDKANAAAAEGSYFNVTIYVRSTNKDVTISLESLIVDASNFAEEANWKSDATFATGTTNGTDSFTAGEEYIFNAINAVRLSFVKGDAAQVLEIKGTDDHGSATNSEDGLTYKYAEAKESEANITTTVTPKTADATVNASGEITGTVTLLNANNFEAPETEDGYYYSDFEVNVWLEGWDPDCINAILNGTVKLGFVLKADFSDAE